MDTQTPVSLSAVVEAMELQSDMAKAYFNRKTGEFVYVTEDDIRAIEEGGPLEDYPEWQRDSIECAREVLNDKEGIYLRLPSKFDIHEWEIMNEFALSLDDAEVSNELYYAMRGSGAFPRFKDAIHEFGVADQWYAYRDGALREIAADWCQRHGIPFTDE